MIGFLGDQQLYPLLLLRDKQFGQCAGLDMEKVLSVISKGAAQSWQMENRCKTVCEGKFDGFGFAVDRMRKDLGICLQEAKRNGARLPVTALLNQYCARLQARGGGRWDTSSLINLLAEDGSVKG